MKELMQIVGALLFFTFAGVFLLFAVSIGRRAFGANERDDEPPPPATRH